MGSEHFLSLLRQTDTAARTGTISELVEEFIQANIDDPDIAESTIPTRRTHLRQFADFCTSLGVTDIKLLNNLFIDQYSVEYSKSHKRSTTGTDRRILKVFFTWVREYKEVDLRAIPESIKTKRDRYKKRKHVDRAVIERVLNECRDSQDKLIIAVFAEAGLRVSELINLKTSDVHWDDIEVRGKGDEDRTVSVTEGLAVQLRRFVLDNNRSPDELLFQNSRAFTHTGFTIESVERRIKKWFKLIADTYVTPHQLRHSMAVMLLLDGVNLVTIQKRLGHKDINTTMIYLRITDPEAKADYNRHFSKSLIV